ncbi:Osmotically-inducible protein OsmY, contains BON domain [Pricia antarctica]|uniref:Osmotically-inducible protein OsmY, contains BON domain n=1 Tax=Pricia antarctica TaxID=641691 RepID=A0A1G7CXH3_9FLAO|nr:BON domain-containing protein [Pricia antarctica]SDE43951.1 Osmotically-inducible protein OsmY, contains BON domain [Pricia antarctica]
MKSDAQIKQDILDELVFEPNIDETQIGIIVEDGVVTLSGVVNDYHKKVLANKVAKRIVGVKAVAEDIEVKYGDDFKKTDKEIAKAAVNALEWNAAIPKEKIMVFVEDGYIYLSGKVVWDYERKAAKRVIQNLLGVKGVVNNIELIPDVQPDNIEEQIIKSLERSANLEANGIRVQVDGDTVQLKGRVHSLKERELAEKAAYKGLGVRLVQNDIVVQYSPEFV